MHWNLGFPVSSCGFWNEDQGSGFWNQGCGFCSTLYETRVVRVRGTLGFLGAARKLLLSMRRMMMTALAILNTHDMKEELTK